MRVELRSKLKVDTVLICLVTNPYRHVIRRWNWKTACLSACFRGMVIMIANLAGGGAGAMAAMFTEVCYRALSSGFCSAVTQAFRFAQPAWMASVVTMALIPAISDTLEFTVHRTCGTQRLGATITATVIITAISTLIELFAMRRGVLVVGQNGGSLPKDLKKAPELFIAFCGDGLCLIQALLSWAQKSFTIRWPRVQRNYKLLDTIPKPFGD